MYRKLYEEKLHQLVVKITNDCCAKGYQQFNINKNSHLILGASFYYHSCGV